MAGTLARTALLLGCVVLTGCATSISSESTLAKRLADRGPVPLSPDNPFIASNLLLNREMERSPELKGFIDHRGQPAALEVERSLLGALRMTLFYPDRGERYALERIESTWVISGPLPGPASGNGVPQTTSAQASSGEPSSVVSTDTPLSADPSPNAPILVTAGRIAVGAGTENSRETVGVSTPFTSPALPPDETTRAALKRDATAGTTQPPAMNLPESRASVLATLIKSGAGRTAELSPRGDVVHYVTNERETVALIAEWYTDSPLNGPRIARMNGRRPNDEPTIGDSIVVPSYLVTNKTRLTDEAIAALTGSNEEPAASSSSSLR